MELTIEKIVIANNVIDNIKEVKLPAKISFRLGRLSDKLTPITIHYNKLRNELITAKYGQPNSDDNTKFTVLEENAAKFLIELNEILQSKEDIGQFTPISIEEFGDVILPIDFFKGLEDFIIE